MLSLVLLAILCGGASSTGSHWYRYFYTWVSGASDFPEYVSLGYLDDKELNYYQSGMKEMVSRDKVMELTADRDALRSWTQILQGAEPWGKANIQTALSRTNQSGGIHTFQYMYGCELREDGSNTGFAQYGWDGNDLISLDTQQYVWVTPVPWGEITKNKWNRDQGYNQRRKGYLEGTCIEWLRKYIKYGEKQLRPVAPSVSFTRLGNSNKLSCVATGFYPQSIEVIMHRDEKDAEMYSSGVRPNHDGTFQMEKHTDYDAVSAKYSCKVAHSGLTEPMILFYEPKADSTVPVIVGIVIAVLVLIALAIVGVVIYKKKAGQKPGYNPAKTSDKGDSSSNSSTNATA